MKKQIIKAPRYTDRKHSSEQALASQRLPARRFVDRKKQAKKSACRRKDDSR